MIHRTCAGAVLSLLLLLIPLRLLAGVSTPHLISFQGRALDPGGAPLATGDVAVRIYDSPSGGALVFDSGSDYLGAVENGIFDVVLGSVTPLNLDNTLLYHLELDINGEEIVGDAAAGRQAFYPVGEAMTDKISKTGSSPWNPLSPSPVIPGTTTSISTLPINASSRSTPMGSTWMP